MKHLPVLIALLLVWGGVLVRTSAQSASRSLRIEQLIDIRHPSNPMWSPDGRHVVFVWDRAGVSSVYVSDLSNRAPRELPEAGATLGGAFWSRDGHALMVPKRGDLWRVPIDGSAASAVWTTPQQESSIVASPDGMHVAFVRDRNDLFVRWLTNGRETHIARHEKPIAAVGWSPDGANVIFTAGAETIRHEQTPAYSGTKIIYTVNENVPGQTFVVPASGGTPTALGTVGGFGGRRWLDPRHFLVDRTSPDFKRRTTMLVDIEGGEPRVLHEDVEDTFWSMTGDANGGAQPSPDGKWVAFLSDRDGWDHLYVIPSPSNNGTPLNGRRATISGSPVQITKGKFEAWRPTWSPDSTRIAFDANEPDR